MLPVDPSLQMWCVFAIIAVAIVLYSIDQVPLEITSLGIITLLVLLFYLMPVEGEAGIQIVDTKRLLSGFADPALAAIVCLLIVGQALIQTGAMEGLAQKLVLWGGNAPTVILAITLLLVLLISAVLNNTPVVVIFIPIMTALAERINRNAAHVLMPLSFAAILGGNITLIGSSTNLLVSGSLHAADLGSLDFFSFTAPGLIIAGSGFLYVLFVMPRLLRTREMESGGPGAQTGHQFLVEVEVQRNSKFDRQKAVAGLFPGLPNMTIRSIQRGGEPLLPPYDDITLRPGDRVTFAATRKVIRDLFAESPILLPRSVDIDPRASAEGGPAQPTVAEAVVAPASRMEGRSVDQSGFTESTHCAVIGVQRRARMLRKNLDAIRLEAGDVLLVIGQRRNILNLRDNRDVLLLEWSAREFMFTDRSTQAILIFGLVVTLAATNVLPIAISAMIGAVLMIMAGCLNVRQAARAIDRRVVMIVAAALAMGASMEATGGANYLANGLVYLVSDMSPRIILGAMFLMIAGMTNILSNNATAVLFTPIAVSIAHGLGLSPMPFVVCVIFAANCSFATPIGYQTNLLVMGPGHYKFKDYLKAGLPLILLMWAVFLVVVPWYYGI